jgi:hypothetical protein
MSARKRDKRLELVNIGHMELKEYTATDVRRQASSSIIYIYIHIYIMTLK